MTMSFKVICINDTSKPNDIPNSQWVKKGSIYTVTKVVKMIIQGGTYGFDLAEINLDGCAPYKYYAADRFGIIMGIEVQEDVDWADKELERLLKEVEYDEEVYQEKANRQTP